MKPISFIIITYNRAADTLELLQNISSLNNSSTLLQDIIIVNNASTENYDTVKNYISEKITFPFQYIDAPSNLGVTKGRNFALQFAKGEICIFLDDDAILGNPDALENVIKSFDSKGIDDREVAIVSFKVLYYSTKEFQKNALPNKQFDKYQSKEIFYTYYFAGGAHAIKRKVLNEVGNLPEDFFYGMEEYDLSYRILDNGYCIKYDSSIIMLHKESPLGRKPKSEKLRMMWVNKTIVAYKYLPKPFFYTTAIMWSIQFLKETNCNLNNFFKGWKAIFAIPKTQKRTRLKTTTLQYLKEVEARLWY